MTMQLQQSAVDKINQALNEQESLTLGLKDSVLNSINKAREIGVFLMELKESSSHGTFQSHFKDHPSSKTTSSSFLVNCSIRSAQRYMTIAKKNPEPITDLRVAVSMSREVMAGTGLIEDSERGQQTKREKPEPWQLTQTSFNKFTDSLTKWEQVKPMEQWDDVELDTFIATTEPLEKKLAQARALLNR